MKTLAKIVLVILVIAVSFGAGYALRDMRDSNGDSEGGLFGGGRAISRYQCHTATTSPTKLAAGASSTCEIVDTDQAIAVDLCFMVTASTTATNMSYEVDVRHSTSDNWFELSGASSSWNPGGTASSSHYKCFTHSSFGAKNMRVTYGIGGVLGDVYLEVIKHNELR